MRILIFGGDGMIGHQLAQSLKSHHYVAMTLREDITRYPNNEILRSFEYMDNIDVLYSERWLNAIEVLNPDVIINAVGVVKQRTSFFRNSDLIQINSVFPHQLAEYCSNNNIKLIQFSTDCIFSGLKGQYCEEDQADESDLYGRSKAIGEVLHNLNCLTLRLSTIGLEFNTEKRHSLIEWFLAESGHIKGFTKAIYTGITTMELGRLIRRLLEEQPQLYGLWQVSAEPIDKYTLLSKLSKQLGRHDIAIEPHDTFVCNRSLSGSKFHDAVGYVAPSWDDMLAELAIQIKARRQLTEDIK